MTPTCACGSTQNTHPSLTFSSCHSPPTLNTSSGLICLLLRSTLIHHNASTSQWRPSPKLLTPPDTLPPQPHLITPPSFITCRILSPPLATIPPPYGMTKTLIGTSSISTTNYPQLITPDSFNTLMPTWKISAPLRKAAPPSVCRPINTYYIALTLSSSQVRRLTVFGIIPTE